MTHPNPRPNGWPGGLSTQAEREQSGVFRGALIYFTLDRRKLFRGHGFPRTPFQISSDRR
jgi:hypothetical protein